MIGDNGHYALGPALLTFAEGFAKASPYAIGYFRISKNSRTSARKQRFFAKDMVSQLASRSNLGVLTIPERFLEPGWFGL
jgi:hypothetical protein